MTNYVYLADILVWVIFLLIYAARPARSTLSHYEIERLAKVGDHHAKLLQRRRRLLPGAIMLKRWLGIILAAIIVWLMVILQGWLPGLIISILAFAIADLLSRWQPVAGLSKKYWVKLEPRLLLFIHNYAKWLTGLGPKEQTNQLAIHSKQELAHIVESSSVFDLELKTRLQAGLVFGDVKVKDVMTLRSEIVTVDQKDTLGPVVLDSLHKTGHNQFPVTNEDINHVIGVLNLNKLVGDMRQTHTAKKAMEPGVDYINEGQSLNDALVAFLHTKQHLLIVVNKSKKTTGIIALGALLEKLIGRKLSDELSEHDNLEVVAGRETGIKK